jgi:hypothetical protein
MRALQVSSKGAHIPGNMRRAFVGLRLVIETDLIF